MTIKNYLAIKNWLVKIEKKLRDEAFEEGASPLEVEEILFQALAKILEAKGIDSEAYFRIDKSLDKKGQAKKEAEEKEINLEDTEEDNEEEDVEKGAKGWVKSFLTKLKKK